jgi:hypothetical protein
MSIVKCLFGLVLLAREVACSFRDHRNFIPLIASGLLTLGRSERFHDDEVEITISDGDRPFGPRVVQGRSASLADAEEHQKVSKCDGACPALRASSCRAILQMWPNFDTSRPDKSKDLKQLEEAIRVVNQQCAGQCVCSVRDFRVSSSSSLIEQSWQDLAPHSVHHHPEAHAPQVAPIGSQAIRHWWDQPDNPEEVLPSVIPPGDSSLGGLTSPVSLGEITASNDHSDGIDKAIVEEKGFLEGQGQTDETACFKVRSAVKSMKDRIRRQCLPAGNAASLVGVKSLTETTSGVSTCEGFCRSFVSSSLTQCKLFSDECGHCAACDAQVIKKQAGLCEESAARYVWYDRQVKQDCGV